MSTEITTSTESCKHSTLSNGKNEYKSLQLLKKNLKDLIKTN